MKVYDSSGRSGSPAVMQFENANEGRSYPFADNATLVSDSGEVLPDGVVADMHLVVPKGMDASLASVYLSGRMLSVCIKVESAGKVVAALSRTVKADVFEPYVPYAMEKLTGSEDVGGVVTFGQVEFPSVPTVYRFSRKRIPLAESAVAKYTPAKLRKIVDDRTGESVSGDVKVKFSAHVDVSRDEDGVHLVLRQGSNDVLLPACDRVVHSDPCGATPVQSINGVLPDDKDRIAIWFH